MSMKRASRRLVPLVLVLSFGLVLGNVTPAAGDPSGTVGTLQDAGVLRLRLAPGSQDSFKYEPPAPGSASTQAIPTPQTGCALSPAASAALVSFSATGNGNASPGFVADAMGVKTGGSTGQPCGQISGTEKLTMNLGGDLDGLLIDFAEIDLELKQQGAVTITGYVVKNNVPTQVGAPQTYSSVGPDSGPDSGDNDNYRVRFPKSGTTAVNRLVFSVGSAGSGSLEGGADGTTPCDGFQSNGTTPDPNEAGCQTFSLGKTLSDPAPDPQPGTTDSLFHLVAADGILDCGDTAPTEGGEDGTPASTLERLDNSTTDPNDPNVCVPIPFNQETGPGIQGCHEGSPQCVLLEKDLLGQDAQFMWEINWGPETGSWPETVTQFDYNFDEAFTDIQLCLADDGSDPGDDVDGFPELPPTADTEDDPAAVDPWCLVDSHTELDFETGLVNLIEMYYGGGDPTGRR